MNVDYPLRFEPNFRRYLWGGRKLETVLGKRLGDGDNYAESWEIVDHGHDQSIVALGPLAGRSLGELVREHAAALLGRHGAQATFPLLFKFLDARKRLSVQVHPDDAAAARLDPPDLGKTEAWVVLFAEPDSVIYAGLKDAVGRADLEREAVAGTTESCLHQIRPRAGDKAFVAVTNPLVNSYKRLVPGYEAPTNIAWSEKNRSPLVRVPAKRGMSTRCEVRMPDPSCNPYLAYAVMLAAGLDGIGNKLDPGAPVNKNIFAMSQREKKRRKIEELPGTLAEALDNLEKDKVILEALGDHIAENFVRAKRAEWADYQVHVHPWEQDRYLHAH